MTPYTKAASLLVAAYSLVTLTIPANAQPRMREPFPRIPHQGCVITSQWEDGSALAYCGPSGERFVLDPDGLGPYCPRTSADYGKGWHRMREAMQAHEECEQESKAS